MEAPELDSSVETVSLNFLPSSPTFISCLHLISSVRPQPNLQPQSPILISYEASRSSNEVFSSLSSVDIKCFAFAYAGAISFVGTEARPRGAELSLARTLENWSEEVRTCLLSYLL